MEVYTICVYESSGIIREIRICLRYSECVFVCKCVCLCFDAMFMINERECSCESGCVCVFVCCHTCHCVYIYMSWTSEQMCEVHSE